MLTRETASERLFYPHLLNLSLAFVFGSPLLLKQSVIETATCRDASPGCYYWASWQLL